MSLKKLLPSSSDEARMTFIEHLSELRIRIIRTGVVLMLAFVLCFCLSKQLFAIIRYPLQNPTIPWMSLGPMETAVVYLKLAGYGAIILCFPHIVYELCAFIFPGLKPRERRAALMLLIGGGVLAFAGVAAAYFLVTPQLLRIMIEWNPEGVTQALQMRETVSFILMMLLAFAVAFQFPLIVLILVYLGIISPQLLRDYRRHAIVLLTILSAVLTPTVDPISMLVMLVPLIVMYEACVWIAHIMVRKRKK